MSTEIRFLQMLEDDLREAAAREREPRVDVTGAPRRLPRRGRTWATVAAAALVVLVIAGAIGFLAQGGLRQQRAASTIGGSGTAAPPVKAGEQNLGAAHGTAPGFAVPSPAPVPGTSTDQGVAFGAAATSNGRASLAGPQAPQSDLSKIVRDGRIGVEVPNGQFTKNVAAVTRIAVRHGGIVLSSSTQNDTSGTFTLRVPAKTFDQVMLQLRALGTVEGARVLYQDTTGQDVTAQFVDLKARLSILRGTKARLVSLQSKATTVNEILALGAKIDDVQLQIEKIQGSLNVIDAQVAESTVRVELREQDAQAPSGTEPPERPSLGSAWDRAVQGFLRVVGAVIVGLGYLIPIGIVALGIWLVVMAVRRRRRAAS